MISLFRGESVLVLGVYHPVTRIRYSRWEPYETGITYDEEDNIWLILTEPYVWKKIWETELVINSLKTVSSLFLTGRTVSSPNMVRTVWQIILHFWIECHTNFQVTEHGWDCLTNCTSFLNWRINEMQALAWILLCRLYTDMHARVHTRHMQPIVHSRLKALAMEATAVPLTDLFICLYLLGPTDNVHPPT